MMGNKKSKKISFWIWDPYVSGTPMFGGPILKTGSFLSGFLSLMSLFLWLLSLVSYIFLGSYFLVPITVDDNIYFRRDPER